MEFVELFLIHESRSIEHDVASGVVLRECDAVADAVQSGKEADETVETLGQASVRGSSILESVHEESELFLGFFGSEAENFEDFCL